MKKIWQNKWVKFALFSIVYLLWFVVWTGNPWWLIGELVIFDLCITRLFQKWVWSRHKAYGKTHMGYRHTMEWVESILFAVVAASLIRLFFFEMYIIPTPSMEKSLLEGDVLCVSKITYGPKMPNTPLSFPLVHNTMPLSKGRKKSYSEAIKWPYKRLAGLRGIERGDAVVFNFPSDTIARPVDKRENYVKRCVGLPGDTLQFLYSDLYVNGRPQDSVAAMQHIYFVHTNGTPIPRETFEKLGVYPEDVSYNPYNGDYVLPMTRGVAAAIDALPGVDGVSQYMSDGSTGADIFPEGRYGWTLDNFGPLWIPSKGASVDLTLDNLPLYERIIGFHEGHTLEVRGDSILIDGAVASRYTFAMDYYFMVGDNRHKSLDSRFWGFVPEDHIVGTPSFVLFSMRQWKVRWDRLFRSPKALQSRNQ